MAKFVFILTFGIVAAELSLISGLAFPMTGPWSSGQEVSSSSVHQVARQARDADLTFEDVTNPCRRYFRCLMLPDSTSFLGSVTMFRMQEATRRLPRLCPHVEEEPANCARGRCSDFHLRTNFYAMPQIRYRFLNWSCDHQSEFQAGMSCWAQPFRTRMRACLRRHGNPGFRSPNMNLMLTCFDDVVIALTRPGDQQQCTQADARFIYSMNRYLVQIWTEVLGNVNENVK